MKNTKNEIKTQMTMISPRGYERYKKTNSIKVIQQRYSHLIFHLSFIFIALGKDNQANHHKVTQVLPESTDLFNQIQNNSLHGLFS